MNDPRFSRGAVLEVALGAVLVVVLAGGLVVLYRTVQDGRVPSVTAPTARSPQVMVEEGDEEPVEQVKAPSPRPVLIVTERGDGVRGGPGTRPAQASGGAPPVEERTVNGVPAAWASGGGGEGEPPSGSGSGVRGF